MTRVAFNPIKPLHVDVGGVVRVFRHTVAPYDDDFKDVGGGASINARFNVTAGTRLLMQSAFGSGLGRYIGGLVPDVAFRRDGSISTIGTTSWVGGVEQKISPQVVAGWLLQRRGYRRQLRSGHRRQLYRLRISRLVELEQPQDSGSHRDSVLSVSEIDGPRFGTVQPAGVLAQERALVARQRTGRRPAPSCSSPRFATTCRHDRLLL